MIYLSLSLSLSWYYNDRFGIKVHVPRHKKNSILKNTISVIGPQASAMEYPTERYLPTIVTQLFQVYKIISYGLYRSLIVLQRKATHSQEPPCWTT